MARSNRSPNLADPDFPGYDTVHGDPFDPDYLRRRAEANPADWRPWMRLGYLLVQRCDAGAVSALEHATALAPENALAHYLLGMAMCREGQIAGAERTLETAVRLRADYAEAWRLLGAIRSAAERNAEALAAWLQVARLVPDGETYWRIGLCFVRLSRLAEATVALEEAVRRKPNHTVAHRALAYLGQVRGEPELTRRHLQTLFTLDEDMARLLDDDLSRVAPGTREPPSFERR